MSANHVIDRMNTCFRQLEQGLVEIDAVLKSLIPLQANVFCCLILRKVKSMMTLQKSASSPARASQHLKPVYNTFAACSSITMRSISAAKLRFVCPACFVFRQLRAGKIHQRPD